jgi:GrpB-like predicted nucleotidyltransferase (UPF0157 family)
MGFHLVNWMKKYVFKPYSPSFSLLFEKEKVRISSSIKNAISIEHVGSTAVPQLGGKGIIDIAIAADPAEIDSIACRLQEIGYLFRESGSSIERRFFRCDLPDEEEGTRRYHVHLMSPESQEWQDLISFRDYLIHHPEEAKKYAELKKRAAAEVEEDGARYRMLKAPLFETILKKIRKDRESS